MTVGYRDLADFLAISELVLNQPADDIARISRLELAESALHAPAASFGGVEFYPDLATKAAVLCTRIVKNHPLLDGNKRVALTATGVFLDLNGYRMNASNQEAVDFTLAVIAGELDLEAIAAWLRSHSQAE